MLISLDFESSGLDLHHGARPFFATTCTDKGEMRFWDWRVDPLTREVEVPDEDLEELGEYVFGGDHEIIGQNFSFDISCLQSLGFWKKWDVWKVWPRVHDTLLASHLLASSQPHDLTSLALQYLGVDIQSYEDALEKAVKSCRSYCRSHLSDWRIAKAGLPDMPSVKEKTWKADFWLPKALVRHFWEESEAGRAWEAFRGEWEGPDQHVLLHFRLQARDAAREQCLSLPGWEYRPPEEGEYEGHHPWWTVLRDYANADSEVTVSLWPVMRRLMEQRGLWKIYEERRKLPPVIYRMAQNGVSLSGERSDELKTEFQAEVAQKGAVIQNISSSYLVPCKNAVHAAPEVLTGSPCPECGALSPEVGKVPFRLSLPKGATPNNSLREFFFDVMGLEKMKGKKAKTDQPTLDKYALEHYLVTLPSHSRELAFVRALLGKRSRDTALTFLSAYERFRVPDDVVNRELAIRRMEGKRAAGDQGHCSVMQEPEGYKLYPSLNLTGSSTLRTSCNNPNAQQLAKKEEANLRTMFGPSPGREWWSLDAKNIEARIPDYESGEKSLITLYERPDDPPYFGSDHLLNFHTIYPEIWESALSSGIWEWGEEKGKRLTLETVGPYCKKKYRDTWYQWVKNFNFARRYGAVDRPDGTGTADRAAHKPGAQALVARRFPQQDALNQKYIKFAERHGYVETLPDRTVDPSRGYPLMCTRTEYGRILPTVPLNFHVQGCACWVLLRGMILVQDFLDALNRKLGKDDYLQILYVHDEIVLDFPFLPEKGNLPLIREVQRLLESVGDDLIPAIPLPFGIEYHTANWGEGETIV